MAKTYGAPFTARVLTAPEQILVGAHACVLPSSQGVLEGGLAQCQVCHQPWETRQDEGYVIWKRISWGRFTRKVYRRWGVRV